MYLKMDLFSPRLGEYVLNERAKNRVLRHWAKTTVNGIQVFGKMFLYNGVVQETADHKKIYQLLGIKVEDLKKESYKGVESVWMYFNLSKYIKNTAVYTNQDLLDFAYAKCVVGETYEVTLTYTSSYALTDDIATVLAGTDRTAFTVNTLSTGLIDSFNNSTTTQNRLDITSSPYNYATFIAIQDSSQLLFNRTVQVGTAKRVEGTVTNQWGQSTTYYYQTPIKLTFSIKPNISLIVANPLLDKVKSSSFIDGAFLYAFDVANPKDIFTYSGSTPYLKVSAVETMPAKVFGKLFKDTIDTDYKEEEAEWYEKLLAIIIIVVAIALSPFTGGTSLTFAAAATAAATIITTLMIAFIVMSQVMLMAGNYGAAIFFGKVMVILQKIGAILGVINIFNNLMATLAQGLKTALNGMMSSFGNLLKGLQGVFNAFSTVTNLFATQQDKQNEEEDAEVEAHAMNSPDNMRLMQESFDSYLFLDANEQMDGMVYEMVQGKIDKATTEYFR